MGDILEIRMQYSGIDCWVCGEPDEHRWGVPTCNGDLVSNDFPDHLWQGGQAVCRDCFGKHARGELETWDHLYVQPGFIDGDGI